MDIAELYDSPAPRTVLSVTSRRTHSLDPPADQVPHSERFGGTTPPSLVQRIPAWQRPRIPPLAWESRAPLADSATAPPVQPRPAEWAGRTPNRVAGAKDARDAAELGVFFAVRLRSVRFVLSGPRMFHWLVVVLLMWLDYVR